MFFIFGWGRQTDKDLGPTLPINCPNCHNDTFWHLHKRETWFTFFFVPVIPYESKHLFLCPTCSRGVLLEGERVDHARQLNSAARDYLAGSMSETDFKAILALDPDSRPLPAAASEAESPQSIPDAPAITYCDSCSFQSFNAVATHCPDCQRPLIPVPAHHERIA